MNQSIGFDDQDKEKMTSPSVVQSSNRGTYKHIEKGLPFRGANLAVDKR